MRVLGAAVGGRVDGAIEGGGLEGPERLAAVEVVGSIVDAEGVLVGREHDDAPWAIGVNEGTELGALGREPSPVVGSDRGHAPEGARADPDDELARAITEKVLEPGFLGCAEHALARVVGDGVGGGSAALVGQYVADATEVEALVDGDRVGQCVVWHALAIESGGGEATDGQGVGVVVGIVMVVPSVEGRDLTIEASLPGVREYFIECGAVVRLAVEDEVPVMDVAHVEERQRLLEADGIEDDVIAALRSVTRKGHGVAVGPGRCGAK